MNVLSEIKHMSSWLKILIVLLCVYILISWVNYRCDLKEPFIQHESYIEKKNIDLFDDFYASIYDKINLDVVKDDYEIGAIINSLNNKKVDKILDIGSGTGNQVHLFNQKGYNCIGLEKSQSMIEKAKEKYPTNTFKLGDALNSINFQDNYFDMITCFNFMIYYLHDKHTFLQNCYNWLTPGGYLVLHLVNRNKYDTRPSVTKMIYTNDDSSQHTKSKISLGDVHYKTNYELNKSSNLATFSEIFKYKNKTRKNTHTLYIPTQKHILSIAQNIGFIPFSKVDLINCHYQHQYLYVLYKPE